VQQLHLVGFTTDLEGLIFSIRKGSKSGGYVIVLDEDLMTKIDEAQRLRNGAAGRPAAGDEPAPRTTATHTSPGRPAAPRLDKPPRPESALSPREIQSRLRSGSSIAQVATDAGVDEEWIARFADPVIAEQDQVAGGARRMFFTKPRLGPSAQPLGTAVRWNLADKGVRLVDDAYDAGWSAFNLHGTVWVVRFAYVSRQKQQLAEWEVDLRDRELVSRNRLASELAYVEPGRRRRPPVLVPNAPARPATAAVGQEAAKPAVTDDSPADEETAAPSGAVRAAPARGRARVATKRTARRTAPTVRKRSTTTSRRTSTARPTGSAATRRRAPAATKATRAAVRKATKATAATKGRRTARTAPARRTATRATGTARSTATRAGSARRRSPRATRGSAGRSGRSGRSGRTRSAAAVPEDRGSRRAPPPVVGASDRASHLARPPAPMESAHRVHSGPFPPYARPVPPRPKPRPIDLSPRRSGAPERGGGGGTRSTKASSGAAPARRAKKTAKQTATQAAPTSRGAGAGHPGPSQGPEPTTRRPGLVGSAPAAAGRTPLDSVWHGPGSGEAPPPVRIRSDLAAARSSRQLPEAVPRGRRRRLPAERRERPLRAR